MTDAATNAWPAYAGIEAPGFAFRLLPAARSSPLPGGLPAQGPQGPYRSMSRACRVTLPADRGGDFLDWARQTTRWFDWSDPFDGAVRRGRIADTGQLRATLARAGAGWSAEVTVEGPLELTAAGDAAAFQPGVQLRGDTVVRAGGRSRQHVMDSGAVMQRPVYSEGVAETDIAALLSPAQVLPFLRWTLAADTGEFLVVLPHDGARRRVRIAGGAAGVEYAQTAARGSAAWEARMSLYGLDSAVAPTA